MQPKEKSLFFFIALFLGNMIILNAQAFYLPVSTTSDEAKKAYQAAAYLASNVRFDAAKVEIDKALEADPNFFMAHALKIQYAPLEARAALIDKALTIDASNFNEAEKIMRQLLLEWDKDLKASPAEAMKALTTAYPNTPEAFEWAYSHAFYTEGNWEKGFEYSQKFIALEANHPPVYNMLGYYYVEKKEMDKAKASFEKYLELAPAEPNAYDSMGEYYMITKEYKKSAEYYDRAVALGMKEAKERAEKARAAMTEKGN